MKPGGDGGVRSAQAQHGSAPGAPVSVEDAAPAPPEGGAKAESDAAEEEGLWAGRLRLWRQSPVTLALAATNVGVFALAESAGSTLETETLVRFGASARALVWQGEVWRLLTAVFLHIGVFHLAANVVYGFYWCAFVERALGRARFLAAYLACGVVASAVSTIGHEAGGAGASGALFGMLGVELALRYRELGSVRACYWHPHTRHEALSAGVWLVVGPRLLNVDNHAHIGGLAFGLLLGLAMTSRAEPALRRRRLALACAAGGLTVLAATGPLPGLHPKARAIAAANAAAQRGDYGAVIALTDPLAGDDNARAAEVLALRAWSHEHLGDPGAMRDDAERLIALHPPTGHFWRGRARLMLGEVAAASHDFDELIKLEPGSALGYEQRAMVHFTAGDAESAVADVGAALERGSHEPRLFLIRGAVQYQRGRYELAAEDYGQALQPEPAEVSVSISALIGRGRSYVALRRYDLASLDFARAAELAPQNAEAHTLLCSALFETAQYADAEAACGRAVELAPADASALINRAWARVVRKTPAASIADFDAAISIEPRSFRARFGRGTARFDAGDARGALGDAEWLAAEYPRAPDSYLLRAKVKARSGDAKGAAGDLRRALELATPPWQNRAVAESLLAQASSDADRGAAPAAGRGAP